MRIGRMLTVGAVVAMGLTTGSGPAFGAGGWTRVPPALSPHHFLAHQNLLGGVAARSANDAWAYGPTGTEHWNGSSWTFVNSYAAVATTGFPDPQAISLGPKDGWLISDCPYPIGPCDTALHLVGTRWVPVALVKTSLQDSFYDVTETSSTDAWAVGSQFMPGTTAVLIEHWNGKTWSVASAPFNWGELTSVSAISPTDVWAVGPGLTSNTPTATAVNLVYHWNGTAWTALPDVPAGNAVQLRSVAAISDNDVWAVGGIAEHWNGTNWTVVPDAGSTGGGLLSIVASSSRDLWVVGNYFANNTEYSYVEHWNGTRWVLDTPPDPSPALGFGIGGLAVIPGGGIWAVGYWVTYPHLDGLPLVFRHA